MKACDPAIDEAVGMDGAGGPNSSIELLSEYVEKAVATEGGMMNAK